MNVKLLQSVVYWFLAMLVLGFLLADSLPNFWYSLFLGMLMISGAFVLKFGLPWALNYSGIKRLIRLFFVGVSSVYACYVSITVAYWYMLELKGGYFDKVLLNPLFLWIVLGFFLMVEYFLDQFTNKPKTVDLPKTVTIYSNRKETILPIHQITYIESCADYTVVHLLNGDSYKNNLTISTWEQNLVDFIRIHRSFLISPAHAVKNGNTIIVTGAGELPISRTYKQKVQEYFSSDTYET